MLHVLAPQIIRLDYWRDLPPSPAYEQAVTEPLDVILNLMPNGQWIDTLGPVGYYVWERRYGRGIEQVKVTPLVRSETTHILLQ